MPWKKNTPPRSDDGQNSEDSLVQRNQRVEKLPHQQQSDSDGSAAVSGDEDEYITVQLEDIQKELQCPICLGIIRKTRTVMECLHRFCRECIDKAMRLGNNECPACRTHCASRRSLRDDPNYDKLISVFYPDIDKYEEEELVFHDEDRARNKQIQASIAQTVHRQSEAVGKKRSSARAAAAAYARRSKVYRSSRGSRNQGANEKNGSDEADTNDHDIGKYSSSPTSLVAGSVGGDENDFEVNRNSLGDSTGLVENCEMLAWGRGGIRSSSRQSSLISGGNEKNARRVRVRKLIGAVQREAQNDVLDIQFILVPLDEQRIPSLQCPHMCCSPTVSIRQLCQYVGLNTDVDAEEVEILLVKGLHSESDPIVTPAVSVSGRAISPCNDELHILEGHETLSELQAMYTVTKRDLIFAYRKKLSASMNSI